MRERKKTPQRNDCRWLLNIIIIRILMGFKACTGNDELIFFGYVYNPFICTHEIYLGYLYHSRTDFDAEN